MKIKSISAYEILDSRGNPTVKAEVIGENGITATAHVPSGASTGDHEALELRDEDPKRYQGAGVLKALANISEKIALELIGMEVGNQKEIDQKMIELDGTANKSNLGANAILGVSLACARAAAYEKKISLYKYIGELAGMSDREILMPEPMCNVINGGAHADSGLDFQEYMLIPGGIQSSREKVRALSEIYHTLKGKLKEDGQIVSVGDEGGFAPKLGSNEEPLKYLVEAITAAGYNPGKEVMLALDVAASEFFNKETKKYILKCENRELTNQELANYYGELVEKYPLILIEDGMDQDDWEGWTLLNAKLGEKINIMGDDFTVTNKERLQQAIDYKALNSILIKLNQIGTVTETIECVQLAYANAVKASVSHRSGETCDDFITDFAVGVRANWLKSGAVARGERVTKYNRLMEIEAKNEKIS